jgi:hypothetical protein
MGSFVADFLNALGSNPWFHLSVFDEWVSLFRGLVSIIAL